MEDHYVLLWTNGVKELVPTLYQLGAEIPCVNISGGPALTEKRGFDTKDFPR